MGHVSIKGLLCDMSVLKIARMEVVMTFGVSFFKIMMC